MAIPSQTQTRSNMREYAFTRDNWLRRSANTVFSNSPAAMIFLGKSLGDYGGNKLMGSGKVTIGGGHTAVVQAVTLAEHAGGGTIPGPWGVHNVDPDDNTRLAEASYKFYQHGIVVNEHELAINSGDAARGSFIENQTRQVLRTLVKQETVDIYSTSASAEGITSLHFLIGNGAVQNLDPANYPTFISRGLSPRNTAVASITYTSGSFAAQGIEDMRTAYNNACEGPGAEPNVILTDYDTHERYEGRLQPMERFQGAVSTADGSFMALAFRNKPVLADTYNTFSATTSAMFFLNTSDDGIQMFVLDGFDNDFGPFKDAERQRASVSPLGFTGNLFIHDRRLCNKMTGITD